MLTENNFLSKSGQYDLTSYNHCTKKYVEGFESAINLVSPLPIFLDANVILRYYSISFNAREKLYKFLESNIHRIFLTAQVQNEILKNRGDNIKKFFQQVSKKVPQEFNSDIVNHLQGFLEKHKTILKDYPYMETELTNHKQQLEKLLQKLNEDTSTKYEENKMLIWKDKLLDLLCKANILNPLTNEDFDILKKDFDLLKKGVDVAKIDSILNKSTSVFPGLGDIKEKPENPYGDFIIFHEIMKYQFDNKTDSIFLTFDNTKGDWMSLSKEPYLHYVYNIYLNTEHLLYIVDAERTLEKILEINIDSLITEQNNQINYVINIDNINKLFETHPIFNGRFYLSCDDRLVNELHESGYMSIEELSIAMDKLSAIIPEVLNRHPGLNTVGVLRYGLRILDDNFNQIHKLKKSIRSVNSQIQVFRDLLETKK